MKSSGSEIQTFSFGQDLVFDAYIMFQEYIGFVKAMNSLKGMKLLYKDRYEDRAWVANIKVLYHVLQSVRYRCGMFLTLSTVISSIFLFSFRF